MEISTIGQYNKKNGLCNTPSVNMDDVALPTLVVRIKTEVYRPSAIDKPYEPLIVPQQLLYPRRVPDDVLEPPQRLHRDRHVLPCIVSHAHVHTLRL